MQNYITYLQTEIKRESTAIGRDYNIITIEHWRVSFNRKIYDLKIVVDFKSPPFFMVGDNFLPDSLLNEFESLCQEPLLHKTPEKIQAFVKQLAPYMGDV